MAELVVETETNKSSGERVYGCVIPEYTLAGGVKVDFMEAIAFGALEQSFAVERATKAVAAVVEARQRKASEIADAVASVTEAVASMPPGNDTKKLSSIPEWKLPEANRIFAKYGIPTMELETNGQVRYEVAYPKQTDVQLVLDTENNDLQQNMNTLQNLVSKRDNAFLVASKVVAKVVATAKDTIRAIGS